MGDDEAKECGMGDLGRSDTAHVHLLLQHVHIQEAGFKMKPELRILYAPEGSPLANESMYVSSSEREVGIRMLGKKLSSSSVRAHERLRTVTQIDPTCLALLSVSVDRIYITGLSDRVLLTLFDLLPPTFDLAVIFRRRTLFSPMQTVKGSYHNLAALA